MIPGGYILLARKTLESDIMNKPALYFKLWSWMLLQAKFRSSNKLERGQFITSINEMREAMSYKVGYRKEKPTIKQIRGVYESLTKGSMIGTTKVTGGLCITICKYGEYQNPKNYEGHNEGVHEGKVKGISNIRKKEKKEKNQTNPLDIYLKDKIKENNFNSASEKIMEFFKYRMSMPQKNRYKSNKGVDGLFRDLNACASKKYDLITCLDITMENNWLTPRVEYFKNMNITKQGKTVYAGVMND